MADYGRGLRVFVLLDMTKGRLSNTFTRTGICHARKSFSRSKQEPVYSIRTALEGALSLSVLIEQLWTAPIMAPDRKQDTLP